MWISAPFWSLNCCSDRQLTRATLFVAAVRSRSARNSRLSMDSVFQLQPSISQTRTVSWRMLVVKLQNQNMIRTKLLVAGLGLALLFATSARAQEISNTQFANGSYTEPFTQPLPADPGIAASIDSQATKNSATASTVDNAAGHALTGHSYPSEGVMWVGVALVWVGAGLAIYFASLAKRFGRSLPSVACSQFNIRLD